MSDANEMLDLASYQARLLELLYGDTPPTEAQVRSVAGKYGDALGPLDPVLLEVASTLTNTWGRVD